MSEKYNKISTDGQGNIILQDVHGKNITINQNDISIFKELLVEANQDLRILITEVFTKYSSQINEEFKIAFNEFNQIPSVILDEKEKLLNRMENLYKDFEKLKNTYNYFWENSNPCTNADCFEEEEWNELFDSIDRGECVLFVGQDISLNENKKSLHEQFNRKLHNKLSVRGVRYLMNDGFFTPRIEDNKSIIEWYYGNTSRHPDFINKKFVEENNIGKRILTKLSHIPFSLILAVAPDNTMHQIYNNLNLNYTYSFFDRKTKGDTINLDEPSKKNPLLYYLIGEPNGKFDNYIYKHKQLYEYIKEIQNLGLPEAIREKLSRASHFLFIGFDLRKWHNQLLLYLIENYHTNDKNVFRRSIMNSRLIPNMNDKINVSIEELKIAMKELTKTDRNLSSRLFEVLDQFKEKEQIVIDKKNKNAYIDTKPAYESDELKLLIKDQFNISFIENDFEYFVDTYVNKAKAEISGDLLISPADLFVSKNFEKIKEIRKKLALSLFDAQRSEVLENVGEIIEAIEEKTDRIIKQYTR